MDAEVVLQEEDMEGSWTLLSWLASFVMVFGGALPYVPQYQEIQKSSNTEGFSTRVCLVLLIANILRIFFWIGKQFELTLLLQSVVMILTMFAMLHLCCTVQNTNRVSTKQHHLSVDHSRHQDRPQTHHSNHASKTHQLTQKRQFVSPKSPASHLLLTFDCVEFVRANVRTSRHAPIFAHENGACVLGCLKSICLRWRGQVLHSTRRAPVSTLTNALLFSHQSPLADVSRFSTAPWSYIRNERLSIISYNGPLIR
ncbi:uncharacterized protein si:dkey-246g23.2 isoform X1 [Oreochromis niloticus]|uniref:uncharacterized protein si:dkey-246g23.2 isoform X1 n=1 Tax=Oreochromis niloticus TaxID=8128 RepID=UPI000DF44898|nr:uncharacterized protein LOC100711201 isoform X1 [Oreochromis niloticus]